MNEYKIQNLQPNLFSNRFNASVLKKNYLCKKCDQTFSSRIEKRDLHYSTSLRPVLLPCLHNICEHCIVTSKGNLLCPECESPININMTEIHRNHRDCILRNTFEINKYLVGDIQSNNFFLTDFYEKFELQNLDHDDKKSATFCNECELATSAGYCYRCKSEYCQACFQLVHSASNVLRKHKLVNTKSDSLTLPKSKICRFHNKKSKFYCHTCDCVCCNICTASRHVNHEFISIKEENLFMRDDLSNVAETIVNARESIRSAQKELRCFENQFENYAEATLLEISNFFVKEHNKLQLQQQHILKKWESSCQKPQTEIHAARKKLTDVAKIINQMRSNLDMLLQHNNSDDIRIKEIINTYNQRMNIMEIQNKFKKLTKNPFSFKVIKVLPNLNECLQYAFDENELNTTFELSVEIMDYDLSLQQKQKSKQYNRNKNIKIKNMTANSNESTFDGHMKMEKYKHRQGHAKDFNNNDRYSVSEKKVYTVRLSHIVDPQNFYIQEINSIHKINELSNQFIDEGNFINLNEIKIGKFCFIKYEIDKLWYRAVISTIKTDNICSVTLIDVGFDIDVNNNQLKKINDKYMIMPYIAKRCAIYNILPNKKKWIPEAKMLILEMIRNDAVQLNLIQKVSNCWLVDLIISQDNESVSVRDALLYTKLGKEKLSGNKKKTKLLIEKKSRTHLNRFTLTLGEMLKVQVLHVESPDEFYVIKVDQIDCRKELFEKLNHYYQNENKEIIFSGALKTCGVICIDNNWFRARIEEIKDNGEIHVRLLDIGYSKKIDWRDFYVLQTVFCKYKEFAIKCSLTDIEPLQENGYIWTKEAIEQFKQFTSNPILHLAVTAVKPNDYNVRLNVFTTNLDLNISAALAKNGHGLFCGEIVDIIQPIQPFEGPETLLERNCIENIKVDKIEKDKKITLKRTEIKITYIKDPDEFYIIIKSIANGVDRFQKQLQKLTINANNIKKEWNIGDHCFVSTYFKYSPIPSQKLLNGLEKKAWQYYRCIITQINSEIDPEYPYSVFLRDIGATIKSINETQLFAIDATIDNISDAAQRCHLADIKPPAGMKVWPQSSIDYLRCVTCKFHKMEVSLNSKCIEKSLPVVLWGLIETDHALAPTHTTYSNINRILVVGGLAHYSHSLNQVLEINDFTVNDKTDNEISISDWMNKFSEYFNNFDDYFQYENFNEKLPDDTITNETKVPKAWLTSKIINKNYFNAMPTNIDFNAAIYIQLTEDRSFVNEMRTKLTSYYGGREDNFINFLYKINQPCLVKYHLDNRYYRGIIKKICDKEYDVYFIDYGNIETTTIAELLPYAPFPNLPSFANKFHIDGIHNHKYFGKLEISLEKLDTIHYILVEHIVSMQILSEYEKNDIKICTIHIGSTNFINMLENDAISKGDTDYLFEAQTLKDFKDEITDNDDNDSNDKIISDLRMQFEESHLHDNILKLNDSITTDNFDLHKLIDTMYKAGAAAISNSMDDTIKTGASASDSLISPPHKKRMFADKEYVDAFSKMTSFDQKFDNLSIDVDQFNNTMLNSFMDVRSSCSARGATALEQSIVIDYLNNMGDKGSDSNNNDIYDDVDDVDDDDDDDDEDVIFKMMQRRSQYRLEYRKKHLNFEDFRPNDTSSIFSNICNNKMFKKLKLPSGIKVFKCEFVSILTPTLIQIIPNLREYNFREMELQQCIKRLKDDLIPLKKFDINTNCLAQYSADDEWYRAIILSNNPIAKTVDVAYLDYGNKESVEYHRLKEFHTELFNWPIRVIKVNLYNMLPNSHLRKQVLCLALKDVFEKYGYIYARIVNDDDERQMIDCVKEEDDNDEIILNVEIFAENPDSFSLPIYEELYIKQYYLRDRWPKI